MLLVNMTVMVFVVLQDARKACSDSTLSQVRLPLHNYGSIFLYL